MAADEERTSASAAFGALLRCHRLAAGLSQEALAARAQMSPQGIGALERGDRRTPQRGTLALLAEALALDVEQRREFEAAAARPRVLRPGDGRVSRTLSRVVHETNAAAQLAATAYFADRASASPGRSRGVDEEVATRDARRFGRCRQDADLTAGRCESARYVRRRRLAHRTGAAVERRLSSLNRCAGFGYSASRRGSARVAG